ncbi:MAG: DUF2871 domain-containing protein [Oscillospiraceae bacterium]
MKKLANTSFIYAILAMIGGVFYREFTKFLNFTGVTRLSFVHLHLFVLGMFFFLVVLLLDKQFHVSAHKSFGKFYITYNLGLAVMVIMLIVRGVTEVLATPMSRGLSAAISGIAGIGHIILGVSILWYLSMLKKSIKE